MHSSFHSSYIWTNPGIIHENALKRHPISIKEEKRQRCNNSLLIEGGKHRYFVEGEWGGGNPDSQF